MPDPIRILHVIGMMNRGGAETMIMNLYRNIDRSKVQFDFVQNDGPEAAFDEEIHSLGGKIYHCPRYTGKNHLIYVRWWHTFFREHGGEYSIVHGHIGSTAAIYLSVAKKYGIFTIAHSHNTKPRGLYKCYSYPTRFIADFFVACSNEAGISRYGKRIGCNKSKYLVLHNAIDVCRFSYDKNARTEVRDSWGIKENQTVIGNVGRFFEQKNHRYLIEIFEKIHDCHENAVLLLVGDGVLRPEIERVVMEKHLEMAVIMAGIKSNTWDFYQAMDVLVMPSLFEGLPVSMVEAQTAGLPCCVSTGVPEEAAITDLVQFRSLEETPEKWAQWIMERAKLPRRDMSEEIRRAGYDISETSRWLENFYLEVERNRGK